jgi:hypothetical protein
LRGFAQNAPEINSAVIGEISGSKKVFRQGSADFCRNWAWYNKLEFYFFREKFPRLSAESAGVKKFSGKIAQIFAEIGQDTITWSFIFF